MVLQHWLKLGILLGVACSTFLMSQPLTSYAPRRHHVTPQPAIKATITPTPTESIVLKAHLKTTYHYRFTTKLPPAGVRAFKAAMRIYNHTGIVHFAAGPTPQHSNQITFTLDSKKTTGAPKYGELGRGGPVIFWEFGPFAPRTWNHAVASLNGHDPGAFTTAVAVHEVGHALGLGHSAQPNSVMYPYTNGTTRLSVADLAGLRRLYQK